jgi:SAM-dependent methyltransferase
MVTAQKPDVPGKHDAEMRFWRDWLGEHGMGARTAYYREFMMNMGGVTDQSLFDDLICVDIGCGPMGSMTWLTNAKAAIGLDPLAQSYMEFGITEHEMIYLRAHAETMPFPGRYVDVVFSMNSLDHVDDLYAACREIRRVLKPGGYFLASLNLHEPATPTEPWTLTEALLAEHLFSGWKREFYEVRPKIEDGGDPYRFFFQECPPELESSGGPRALWCRFKVPPEQTAT